MLSTLSTKNERLPPSEIEGARDSAERSFLDWLCAKSLISLSDQQRLGSLIAASGESFDQVITKTGLIDEQTLTSALATFSELVVVSGTLTPDFTDLNRAFLEARRVILLREGSGATILGIVNPFDETLVSAITFALRKEFTVGILSASQWEALFYTADNEADAASIAPSADKADINRLSELASTEPVIRLVNRLVADGVNARASDIHIEATASETIIRYRIDGVLAAKKSISRAQGISAISRIKILAGLDIAERRRPQDGRFSFPVAGKSIDLRVSTVPTDHGESAVLRILDKSTVKLDYDALGFESETVALIRDILAKPHGIVLLTGPTGSGKTTTLYTFLKELAACDRKILTIEDPIEYRLPGISQSQVNPAIGVTFASALRSFLRHDPDIMMVGEIRDLETATIATQAALTGHLVLSTLHTNDAPSAITRLRDLGLEDYLIASTLNGVIAQRLVRRKCEICDGHETCPACHGQGYRGRVALTEILEIDGSLSDLIRNGKTERDISSSASTFRTMRDDAASKIDRGLTTRSEVDRVLGRILNIDNRIES